MTGAMNAILLALAVLVAAAGPAAAQSEPITHRVGASADASLPFWCDWGYDWEERCYRDLSDRLPVGGEDDKVWRSALRFPLDSIPPGSMVVTASLFLSFDGVCLAPRKTERPCPTRSYTIDVHPVHSREWFDEREIEFGPPVDKASFWTGSRGRLSWDVTELVVEWVENGLSNDGLLLKLADGEEDFSVSGPKLPSSEYAASALRPALEVTYINRG
jgi:hypothetical protein